MVTKHILQSKLTEKFSDQLLHAIVNECFVNALPIDKDQITPEESKSLRRYSYDVVKSIGGIHAVESAVDFDNKTLQQNVFLGQIYDVCTESAKACARRNTDEEDCKKRDTNLAAALSRASLSEEEYKKFAKKADNMNLDEVSKIIKEKTLAVIKDEQEQYEKEQKLDEELKAALKPVTNDDDDMDIPKEDTNDDIVANDVAGDVEAPSPDDADIKDKDSKLDKETEKIDKSVESLMDLCLNKTDPRHHVTVFSRLQETAMEMMDVVKVGNDGEDYFPIIYKTTFESFLKDCNGLNMETAIESMQQIAKEEVCEVHKEDRSKIATLVSIVVYTMMETLKTMGIYCPKQSEIQGFVNRNVDSKDIVAKDNAAICEQAKKCVTEAAMYDFSKMKSTDLTNQLEKLKTAMEMTTLALKTESANTELINIASEATNQINKITDILNQRNLDLKAARVATESYNTKRQKSSDLAQFNRIGSMFGKNPQVSEIQLRINPNMVSSIIDVKCANESGNIIRESYMDMSYACEEDVYLPYLKERFESSNMKGIDKHVSIIVNDGRGTKITLQ